MIASPDLLAFTVAQDIVEAEEDQDGLCLPEELSVPLVPPRHPWESNAYFHRDFILVAEFSEQVGPKPVLTIPDDPRVVGSFDLNHFSVRIMSVDYQASGPAHSTFAFPGPRLNFSEDSKVILGDSAEDAFAYVHHLTLYDLEARGLVRPFCMAYVCSDQAKLMENFTEISTGFSLASDSLKTGNRQAFSVELQRKLQELECTRLTLQQEAGLLRTTNGITGFEEKAEDLETVELSISNHRELLRQVTSFPNRKLKRPDFLPYDPADALSDPAELCAFLPGSASSCMFQHRLKPLQKLSSGYFLSLMLEQLADTEQRLRGDRSTLRTARTIHSLSRRLTLTNFLFDLWIPGDMEEEEERERSEAGLQAATVSKRGVGAVRMESVNMESFCSCVKEIPIKMEAGNDGTMTLDSNGFMEMIGSVSSSDSIEVLGTEKSFRTQQVVAGPDTREIPAGTTDTCVKRVDPGIRRLRAYAIRANSEDSIEVLSTTESIIPEDLTAITEEEPEHQFLASGFQAAEGPQTQRKYDDITEEEEPMQENEVTVQEEPAEREETLKTESRSSEVTTREKPVLQSLKRNQVPDHHSVETEAAVELSKQRSNHHSVGTVHSVPSLQMNLTPPVALAEVSQWPPPGAVIRQLSADEASDCTSFTSSSDTSPPTRRFHGNTHLDRRRRKGGHRALRFLKQNSFSQHAVFCLLSGRPLVVVGGDEKSVRKLVDTLSLFLPCPGLDRKAVIPCLATPLQLTDLLTLRLIGLHRSPSTSSSTMLHSLARYSRYLAVLDMDQRTLRCPSYTGVLIGRLADPRSGFTRGSTYLLHLESCLTALANQALLHTFTSVLHHLDVAKDMDLLSQGLCNSEDDMKVMDFLSDLITQRHAGRGPPILRFSYNSVHLHRNTTAT
ncbi:guanine nucleotide exchange protein smcr8b [Thalassophryne amazonica]|uniref:guanine nucleotide exchange protein smcr8b n=1 Tax=Thalassophryne amazonica TaxID=390379 RepID=UPI0014717151|nr:guanine nucleotide exchange protein smcr8b [Thalassophryne amazonica]